MKFFTDKTVESKYLLIKIKDYLKLKDFSRWDEILIDPGVYELTKDINYSWVSKGTYSWMHHFLDGLPDNHYFSWDYPPDMNEKYTQYFLDRTWDNAQKYCNLSHYIVTVQSRFKNYMDFKHWFDKYNKLKIESGILAVGNLCRIHFKTEYIKHALDYAFSHCKHKRIHIYGLGLRIIPYAYNLAERFNIELSMDSTKWTRCHHTSGLSSCGNNRQEYFNEYIETLESRGIKIE